MSGVDGPYDDASLDATARVVDPGGDDEERQVEAALRPKRLSEFPGQTRVRDQLQLVLEAARRRDAPPDHILLSGPLVIRIGCSSSAATIMARVVLPRPGGPDSRMWSGGASRRRAASRTSCSWSRTRVWPGNSLSRLGRSAAST